LALLRSRDVDVAFVQGGLAEDPASAPDLLSLGSLYFEPLWVFHRLAGPMERLSARTGKRVPVGSVGSGTRPVALRLLSLNNRPNSAFEQHDIGGQTAVDRIAQHGD